MESRISWRSLAVVSHRCIGYLAEIPLWLYPADIPPNESVFERTRRKKNLFLDQKIFFLFFFLSGPADRADPQIEQTRS